MFLQFILLVNIGMTTDYINEDLNDLIILAEIDHASNDTITIYNNEICEILRVKNSNQVCSCETTLEECTIVISGNNISNELLTPTKEDLSFLNEERLKRDKAEFDCFLRSYCEKQDALKEEDHIQQRSIPEKKTQRFSLIKPMNVSKRVISKEEINQKRLSKPKRNRTHFSRSFNLLRRRTPKIVQREKSCLKRRKYLMDIIIKVVENIHLMWLFKDPQLCENFQKKNLTVDDTFYYLKTFVLELKNNIPSPFESNMTTNFSKEAISLYIDCSKDKKNYTKNMRQLTLCAKSFSDCFFINDLIIRLLKEIKENKVELVELKSTILIIFFQDLEMSELKLFVSKMIILINIANSSIQEDWFLVRINLLLIKSIIRFLYTKHSLQTESKIRNYSEELRSLEKVYRSIRLPIQYDNLIFMDLILGKGRNLIEHYVLPMIELTSEHQTEFNKLSYSKLLREIELLYEIAEIFI